jgi:hypothetical protein
MKRILPTVVSGCLLVFTALSFSVDTKAAEITIPRARVARALPQCRGVGPCSPGCLWHGCRPICPEGYSCYPLYGAYGPYGGIAYWDAYTGGGWEYRRW